MAVGFFGAMLVSVEAVTLESKLETDHSRRPASATKTPGGAGVALTRPGAPAGFLLRRWRRLAVHSQRNSQQTGSSRRLATTSAHRTSRFCLASSRRSAARRLPLRCKRRDGGKADETCPEPSPARLRPRTQRLKAVGVHTANLPRFATGLGPDASIVRHLRDYPPTVISRRAAFYGLTAALVAGGFTDALSRWRGFLYAPLTRELERFHLGSSAI